MKKFFSVIFAIIIFIIILIGLFWGIFEFYGKSIISRELKAKLGDKATWHIDSFNPLTMDIKIKLKSIIILILISPFKSLDYLISYYLYWATTTATAIYSIGRRE